MMPPNLRHSDFIQSHDNKASVMEMWGGICGDAIVVVRAPLENMTQ